MNIKVNRIRVYSLLLCLALVICLIVSSVETYIVWSFVDLFVSFRNIFLSTDIEIGFEISKHLSFILFIIVTLLSLIGIIARKKIGVLMSYVVGFSVCNTSWMYIEEFVHSNGEEYLFLLIVLCIILFGTSIILLSRAVKRHYFEFKKVDFGIMVLSYLALLIA